MKKLKKLFIQIMSGKYLKIILLFFLLTSCSVDKNLNRGTIVTGVAFAGVSKASNFTFRQSVTIGITSAIVVYTLNKIFKH